MRAIGAHRGLASHVSCLNIEPPRDGSRFMSARSPHRRPRAPALDFGPCESARRPIARSNTAGSKRARAESSTDAPDTQSNFDTVYDENVDFVWRSARRLGVSTTNLEDVVQEVFIVVHRKLDAFEGRSSLRTWLYGITLHVVRNHKRSGRRKPMNGSEEASRAVDNAPISDRQRPDAVVERQRARDMLQRILNELPDDLSEVLVMAELENMSGPDIAAVTGLKVATVYGRLKAARIKFNDKVGRHTRQRSS